MASKQLSDASKKELLPIVPFNEQLSALASITHIRDYSPTISRKPFPDQAKHLRLLDAIALLLVTEEKSDVGAVMFEQTPTQVIFYFCKNRPCTKRELDYVDGIRRLAFEITDVQECSLQLLNRVIPMCRSKIVSRLKRLLCCIPLPLHIFDDVDGAFHEHLIAKMPHLFKNPDSASVACGFLVSYIDQLRKIDANKCTDQVLGRIIRFASAFGSYKSLKVLIRDDVIVRRLRKLGNYYCGTKSIAKAVARLQYGAQHYGVGNVFFQEVPPPPQSTKYFSSDHLAILNRYGASCGLDPITLSSLKAAYPNCSISQVTRKSSQRITHSVHAECTLAMHALAMHKDWTYVEIGVSKGSCWLCEQFLHQMQLNFLVSHFHGKLQPGWTCPVGVAQSDRDSVEGVVGHSLQEVIERVLNRRRSDSFPHAGSDDEVSNSVPDSIVADDLGWVNGGEV